jgi:hypothetical protein
MTLHSVKHEAAKPSATVFECKPCKLSVTATIKDNSDDRTLQ